MKLLSWIIITAALCLGATFGTTVFAAPLDVSTPRFGVPPNITTSSNRPMLMLATSKDHSLFGPIYTDYEDLEGDGTINTTFEPTFKYYGYFDATKCYVYANSRFEPAAMASTTGPAATALLSGSISGNVFTNTAHGSGIFYEKMALIGIGVIPGTYIQTRGTGAGGAGTYIINNTYASNAVSNQTITGVGTRYTCGGAGQWSGNFLNWATMTRMDVVRKLLYGGKRSTDTATLTVLERANLSQDAHSFTKHYSGIDIRDYTPFTVANLTKSGPYAGLTICNRSSVMGEGGDPVIRLAKGNYRMWSTVEGTVCQWGSGTLGPRLAAYYVDTDKGAGPVAHELNAPTNSTDGATYSGVGSELILRVKVCDSALLGEERCQAFPPSSTTNYKPFGLFQEFGYSASGDAARAEFGVITGSYDNNLTAGALRKNMGDFADEINANTGVFCHSASSGCSATIADGRATGNGAIKTMDAFVLYGRNGSGYDGSASQLPSELTNGTLSAWGNPVGEMLIQTFQYYAGVTSTNPSVTSKDTTAGLPVVAWTDPISNTNTTRKGLYGNSVCRPLYSLALSSSALSFDAGGATFFNTLPVTGALGTLDSYVDSIGAAEGLNGSTGRSVGSINNGFGETCSGKTISTLSKVSGVCPDAPGIGGTYQIAGAAYYANTTKIRTISSAPSDLAKVQDALKIKTLTASLSGGAARIDVLIPNSNPKAYVYITPESLWAANSNGKKMPGALLTLNSINYLSYATTAASATVQTGTFMVTWNDSLFGGDYDMDIAGFIRYDVKNPSAIGRPYTLEITTDIVNVGAGWTGTHGFSVIGVSKTTNNVNADGRYLTHRHLTNDSVLAGSEGHLCSDPTYRAGGTREVPVIHNGIHELNTNQHCNTSTGWNTVSGWTYAATTSPVKADIYAPVVSRFNMVGAQNAIVKDPLWYAAKYGSFTSSVKTGETYTEITAPTLQSSWDKLLVDGSSGSDSIPDAYFLARRPELLEEQLRQALDSLAKNSNAAPAVSSSQLITDGLKYVAKFDSNTVDGNIEAYAVDALGNFATDPNWKAGQLLRSRVSDVPIGDKGESRKIITNSGNFSSGAPSTTGGFAFRWGTLPAPYRAQMTTNGVNKLSTTNASLVVDYMRGDQSKENASTGLRVRGDNLLGPVVNATPWIQSPPIAFFSELYFPGYRAFSNTHKARDKLLWVAANDGMLHAFNPKKALSDGGGSEVFAYVPGSLANRLAEIPLQRGTSGRTRLNGANFTADTSETLPQGKVWPYVDGSPYTGDVCLTTTSPCTWRTYVFGSLGRGGKSIFALDSTDIAQLKDAEGGSNSNSIFKWQFTSDDDADLGYIVNDVATNGTSGQASPIVKLNNGKFALLLGNGQRSSSGKSVLFLIYVDGPTATGSWTGRYQKIVADDGTGNGLSAPTWVDFDGNGTADAVYAGDLKGNLWKFDLTSSTDTAWAVAYKSGAVNKPLITAKDGSVVLPITTAPEIVYPNFDGLIITFGTGNAFESADFPKSSVVQKVYGVWDRPGFAGTTPDRALPTDLSTLVPRTFARQPDGSVIVTGTPGTLDWATKDGWYFNLPGSSEMILSDPLLRAGVLTVTSVRPKTTIDNCSDTPSVTLYTLDPLTGKAEKNIQGTTTIGTETFLNTGRDIEDQKVRTVNDRTIRAFTKKCKRGEPGCVCATSNDDSCEKTGAPTCGPGQAALRVIGQSSDATLCYSANARVQWREIQGLRTSP